MNQTIKVFFALCFLAISSLSYAQIEVDSVGRIIFGKQPYSKAISIVDETSSSTMWNKPFRITYKSNEMINLSRNNSYGMTFTTSGSILLGYNLPTSSTSYIRTTNPSGYTYAITPNRPAGTWNSQMGYGLVDALAAVEMANCAFAQFVNQTVSSNTSPYSCHNLEVQNVTVQNNAKLTLDAPE